MTLNKKFGGKVLALSITMFTLSYCPQFVNAQGGDPTVSMVTLQTRQGIAGHQMVVTPKGMILPLPGEGVNGSVVQIYLGSSGGYWYVDKNGQNFDLTPYVQRLQARISQNRFMNVPAPQSAPPPAAPVQVINQQSQPSSSTAGSAMVGAAAAGLGAMAGAAVADSWASVPYGAPVYYGAGAHPYYYDHGRQVNINAADNNVKAFNTAHASELQDQQRWYQHQQAAHTNTWQNWKSDKGENPFVRSDSSARREGASHRGGFGRRGRR